MAWENGLGKSEVPEGFNSRSPRCSGVCIEQFLVGPESYKEKAVAAFMPIILLPGRADPLLLYSGMYLCASL